MKLNFKPVAAVLATLLAIVCLFLFVYHRIHRSIPMYQLLTTGYWIRHAKGHDFYDPDGAMLYHGNPRFHEVALTIDDGPHQIYGQPILNVLAEYQVPATFFVVGVRVKQEPEQIRQMIAMGNEIGNHTYDHPQPFDSLKPHLIKSEIKMNDDAIYRVAGIHTNVMRPPGMHFNDNVLDVAKKLGYVTVNWTNLAHDYEKQTPDYIVHHVVDSAENGSIILLHQDNPYTAGALPRIIMALKRRGYRFVTVSTMLAHLGVQPYADQEANALKQHPGAVPVLANGDAFYEPAPTRNARAGTKDQGV
ncbi:MAG: polysaccharide deacetylase family protein [Capsulimonadaceae bacterium]|nr:polysaccharide deacetylase family protein [Capsulimonadaceae bacterium]